MSPGLKMILGLVLRGLIQHSAKDKEKKSTKSTGTRSDQSAERSEAAQLDIADGDVR